MVVPGEMIVWRRYKKRDGALSKQMLQSFSTPSSIIQSLSTKLLDNIDAFFTHSSKFKSKTDTFDQPECLRRQYQTAPIMR